MIRALVVLALTTVAGSAAAQEKNACVAASEAGIADRDAGRLRSARKHFTACAADACPKPLSVDCARWLEEIDRSLPTIVLAARDSAGRDLFDVHVLVDGEPATGYEHGQAMAVDPGTHVVRFEHPGRAPVQMRVLVRAGERNRPITATFAAPEPPPKPVAREAEPSPARPPTSAFVLGGIGVFALASFGFFAATGAQEKARLRSTCAPACTDEDVSTLRSRYIAADVSLAVGVLALGAALYLFVTDKPSVPAQRFARTIWK